MNDTIFGVNEVRTPTAEVTNLAAPVTPSSLEDVLIGIVDVGQF
jgi:hypothetical protein